MLPKRNGINDSPEMVELRELQVDLGIGGVVCLIAPVTDQTAVLTSVEAAAIESAVATRKREFSTGRRLAHRALAHIDRDAEDLPRGGNGQPLWPRNVVGSISHCPAHAVVAVASQTICRGLGIDLELAYRVTADIVERLLTARERRSYRQIDPTLVFSAKEACYKLLHPVVSEYIDYLDVEVDLDIVHGTFRAHCLEASRANDLLQAAHGVFRRLNSCWLTCVVLDAAHDLGSIRAT
jgi:4'-phosphopantetheinyl transferase EntD